MSYRTLSSLSIPPLYVLLSARVLAIHPTLNLSRYLLFSLSPSWPHRLDIPPSVGVIVAEFVVSGDDGDWVGTALDQEDVDRHLMSPYNCFLSYALCRAGSHSQSFCTDCEI